MMGSLRQTLKKSFNETLNTGAKAAGKAAGAFGMDRLIGRIQGMQDYLGDFNASSELNKAIAKKEVLEEKLLSASEADKPKLQEQLKAAEADVTKAQQKRDDSRAKRAQAKKEALEQATGGSTSNGNTGNGNTGNGNTGNGNTGNGNTGNRNIGNGNTGNSNTNSGKKASSSIYEDLGQFALNIMQPKVDPSGESTHDRNKAEIHDKSAQDLDKAAQKNLQIANRDYRSEAEKNAVSQAASENAQKVANMGNASAGAAALERGVAKADYDTHMKRSDEQRKEGVQNKELSREHERAAEQMRSDADARDYSYKQNTQYNNKASRLSRGTDSANEGTEKPKPEEPKPEEPKPEEPKPEEPKPEEPKPEEPKPEEQPVESESDLQSAYNYATYANDPTSKWNASSENALPAEEIQRAAGLAKKYNVTPLTAEDVANIPSGFDNMDGGLQKVMAEKNPEISEKLLSSSARRDENGNQINAGDIVKGKVATSKDFSTSTKEKYETSNTPSDIRLKDIIATLADIRY